jgi:sporulation protein YlmC with PRC-barrel domain
MRLELGKPIRSSDNEVVGKLGDVIIDPVKKRVTHLVVEPSPGRGESRLVSAELAQPHAEGREVLLSCSAEEVRKLPNVEEFAYLRLGEAPVADPDWDVGVTSVLALPYFDATFGGYGAPVAQDVGLVYHRVPKGEVEVRRASSVITADGALAGTVEGFLVDDDENITHVVLERGHLWGRREVTVPIGAVTEVESDTVKVGLSAAEIEALPAHRVHRWPLARENK